jgi:hypothetical protein
VSRPDRATIATASSIARVAPRRTGRPGGAGALPRAPSGVTSVTAARAAGVAYGAAAVGFVGVFGWLAARFDYPAVLDGPAAQVLPALLALGATGRAVWALYALLPLLLLPAAAGASAALRRPDGATDGALALARALHVVAALAMTLGLARWSTLHWVLAEAWPAAAPATQAALAVAFHAANVYLGVAIGEFVGELALYGAFVALAAALRGCGASRALTALVAATGLLGWVGMWRNVTDAVQPVADVVNLLLPLCLLALAVWLSRARPAPAP